LTRKGSAAVDRAAARSTERNQDHVQLSGKLEQTDLFEICQFLLMGQKTGVLDIEVKSKRGAIYFDHGQIVNAVDDALGDGEEAAYRIFSWKGGAFSFRAVPPPGLQTITQGTESLILDIARFMDEKREERKQAGLVDEDERMEQATHEESVRQRSATGDELRKLFATLQGASRDAQGGDDPLASAWERARRDGHEAVLVRPGEPALGLRGGLVTPLPGSLEEDTVTMAIAALGAKEGAGRRQSKEGAFTVTLVREAEGEALFLQGVIAKLDWKKVGLPADWLEEAATAPRGLVWLGAPPAAGRTRTARAFAEEAARQGRFTVLLSEGAQEPGKGALSVRSTDDARLDADLRKALHEGAAVVVVDLVRGVKPSSVAHAGAKSLVVACEPTPDLRTLLARAAQNARSRSLFLGAMFVTFAGERGHYESLWLPDEARLGLDFERHPDRILGLAEDPSALSDAGPLAAA
jgi:hypothetical protein